MKQLWGGFAVSALLTACGSSVPAATRTDGQLTPVTLSVELPVTASGLNPGPLSAPTSSGSATVNIYDGSTLVTSLAFDSTTTTQSVNLNLGKSYRFDTSVLSTAKVEVAWGTVNYQISTGLTAKMVFNSIIAAAKLAVSPFIGQSAQIALSVSGVDGADAYLPLADYTADYTATGATIQNPNKLGAAVTVAGPTDVTVTASVIGLAADHTVQTFTSSLTFPYSAPQGVIYSNKIANWPTSTLTASVSTATYGPNTLSGQVDQQGNFTLQLPDGPNGSSASDLSSSFPAATWSVPLGTLKGLVLRNPTLQGGGIKLGNFYLKNGVNEQLSYLTYVNQNATASGFVFLSGSYHTYAMSLKQGWNVVNFSNTISAVPLNQLPVGADWIAAFTNINDISVQQSTDVNTVLVGNLVNHTVKLTRNSPTLDAYPYRVIPIKLAIPQELTFVGTSCAMRASDPTSASGVSDYYCTAMLNNIGEATLKFQTMAQPLTTYPNNPSTVTASVDGSTYINLNTSSPSSSVTIMRSTTTSTGVNVDGSLGTVKIVPSSLPTLATLGTSQALNFTVTAQNPVSKVEVYQGVRLLGTAQKTIGTNAYTYAWTSDQRGTVPLVLVAYDALGNTGTYRFSVTVQDF